MFALAFGLALAPASALTAPAVARAARLLISFSFISFPAMITITITIYLILIVPLFRHDGEGDDDIAAIIRFHLVAQQEHARLVHTKHGLLGRAHSSQPRL